MGAVAVLKEGRGVLRAPRSCSEGQCHRLGQRGGGSGDGDGVYSSALLPVGCGDER